MAEFPSDDIGNDFTGQGETKAQAFSSEDLVPCPACSRKNAPNRISCIYCGAVLPSSSGVPIAHEPLPPLESWEKGFNVIASPPFEVDDDSAQSIARIIDRDPQFVRSLAAARGPVPIARFKSREIAERIGDGLHQLSWRCTIVSDEELRGSDAPSRLGGMEFETSNAIFWLFNTGELITVPYDDLGLLVSGSLATNRVDSHQKRKSQGRSVALGETTVSEIEPVLDIYIRRDPRTFRINFAGFDFSCLGKGKSLIAADNFQLLKKELADRCTGITIDESYNAQREFITPVWDIENSQESQGMKRTGFGQRAFAVTSTTNNREQFTRYSRLLWYLNEKQSKQS